MALEVMLSQTVCFWRISFKDRIHLSFLEPLSSTTPHGSTGMFYCVQILNAYHATVYPKMEKNTRTPGIELSFVRGSLSEQAFWRIYFSSRQYTRDKVFSTDYNRVKHSLTIDWVIHRLTRLSSALWFKIYLNMIMVLAGADLRQGGLTEPSIIPRIT